MDTRENKGKIDHKEKLIDIFFMVLLAYGILKYGGPYWNTGIVMQVTVALCTGISIMIIIVEGEKEREYIGLFPTIGMAGTFIGIAFALPIGMQAGANDDVYKLVGGLSTAVYTTVCGMMFYLTWTAAFIIKDFVLPARYAAPEENLQTIADQIGDISEDLSEKLSANLESMLIQINETIERSLGEELKNFSKASNELLQWYETGMKTHTKSIVEMKKIHEQMEDILGKISSTLDKTVEEVKVSNEAIDQRNEALGEQNLLIDEWVLKINGLKGSITDTVEDLNAQLLKYKNILRESLDQVSSNFMDNLDDFSEKSENIFEQKLNNITKLQSEMTREIEGMIFRHLEEISSRADNQIKVSYEQSSDQFKKLSENFHSSLQSSLQAAENEKKNITQDLTEVSEKIASLWGQQYDEMTKVLKKLQADKDTMPKRQPRSTVSSADAAPKPEVSPIAADVPPSRNVPIAQPKAVEELAQENREPKKEGWFLWPFGKK